MGTSQNNYDTITTKLVTVTAAIILHIYEQLSFASLTSPLQTHTHTHTHGSGGGKISSGGGGRLAKLCEKVTSGLTDCLNYDLILYQESCSDKVWEELGAELPQTAPIINLACFSDEDLLKLSALSILPSYSLRSLGNPFFILHNNIFCDLFSIPDVQVPQTLK